MPKRNNLEVIYDIVSAIQDGKKRRTHIMQRANLSHPMLEAYLSDLLRRNMIVEEGSPKKRTYALTRKGYEFLEKYRMIIEFLDTF